MSSDEELSPEEKLLKVIQEHGDEDAVSPDAPAPVAEEAAAAIEDAAVVAKEAAPAEAPVPDKKPKLRLAKDGGTSTKQDDAGSESPPPSMIGGGDASDSAVETVAPEAATGSSRAPRQFGLIRRVNHGLRALVFVLLCLLVFAIARGLGLVGGDLHAGEREAGGTSTGDAAAQLVRTEPLAPWEQYAESVKRDIFIAYGEEIKPPPPPDNTWMQELSSDLSVIAVSYPMQASRAEAMVRYKSQETRFMRIGDTLKLSEVTVRVKSIGMKEICFEDAEGDESCVR